MIKTPLCLLAFLIILDTGFVCSQNLVINPGFENIGSNGIGSHELRYITYDGWTDPTAGSSDISIEKKQKRHKYARYSVEPDSGRADGGFYGSRNGQYWAEYLQGTLTEPLSKKTEYTFSVSVKNSSDEDEDVIDYIGISFSDASRTAMAEEHESIALKADLILSQGISVTQTNEWTRYTIRYTAKGGEQYFIIGTFDPSPRHHHANGYDHSPYFICDNFSLTRVHPPGPIPDFVFQDDSTNTNSQFTSRLSSASVNYTRENSSSVWNSTPALIVEQKNSLWRHKRKRSRRRR